MKTQYDQMITLINDTHHEILNSDSFAPIKHTAITRIQETISNLVEHLKHDNNILTRENSQINNTIHSSHADTTHNPNTTNNSNISSNNPITTINSNLSHNNSNTAHNSNTTHSHSHTTNSQNNTNSSGLLNRPSLRDRIKKHTAHNPDQCYNPSCLTCAELNIVNLSSLTLSRAQKILLNRSLSFVPTASNATTTELLNDLHQFTARTKRQLYRIAKPPKLTGERILYRKPPPDKIHSKTYELGPKALEDVFEVMRKDIANMTQDPTNKPNLTRNERSALKELASNQNIIINKADKGSTIVVRDEKDYIQEGLEHLSDPNTYLKLDRDLTDQVVVTIRNTLVKLKKLGLLSPNMANYCMPPANCRTDVIYFLKKIHKNPMGIRPIVSTTNSATANLAEFLDIYLQPIMKQLPAYLKDTTQFIREISDLHVHKDSWLVTIDVKSLYTNIPNEEGIQACYEAWLKQEITDPQHPPAETLKQLLELVLKLNVFEFNGEHFLQKFGTAMGCKLALAYANTFMGKLEAAILAKSSHKPLHYRRYIDDIFLIWPHSEDRLVQFITHINRANKSIQFTHEKSQEEIVFLDVIAYKQIDPDQPDMCKLHTKTYIKPTNRQLYVRQDSYHPPGTGKGITVGEAIRYLRTNSEKANFSKMLLHHKRNLMRRGYSNAVINKHLRSIKFSMRKQLILKSKDKKNNYNITRNAVPKPTFTTRYCPNSGKAFRIVRKHWPSITTNMHALKTLIRNSPRLAYKANLNLSKKLVRAKIKRDQSPLTVTHESHTNSSAHVTNLANLNHQVPRFTERGITRACNDKHCPLHDKFLYSSQIRSRKSGRMFNTHGKSDCNTKFVVYLIQCKKCKRQYVGQTSQSLKSRFSRHLTQIRNPEVASTLHEHFRSDHKCRGTYNIGVQPLQVVTPSPGETGKQIEDKLKSLETLWMNRLVCVFPQGLNWIDSDPRRRCK